MEELRAEMTKRVESLKRRIEYNETQRTEHQAEIARVERENATSQRLVEQYEQVLTALPPARQ